MYKHLPSYLEKNFFFRKIILFIKVLFFTRKGRKHFSQYGEDVGIGQFIDIKQKGVYVDVGCYHPIKNNNTYKLYKKGWEGINIDVDSIKIEAFNLVRPRDVNITAAISDKEEIVPLYSFGFYTLISTLDKEFADRLVNDQRDYHVSQVKTQNLTEIIENSRFRGKKIDLLSVDVEGHDLCVLRSLSFEKYYPKVIMVEHHVRNIDNILKSELNNFLIEKGYHLGNWVGPTLIYVSN